MRTTMRGAPPQPGLAASSGTTGDPDMVLIGELMEDIQRNPPAIAARKLLVEHYISVGWLEAALENAKELQTLGARGDSDVQRFITLLEKKPEPPLPEKSPARVTVAPKMPAIAIATAHTAPVAVPQFIEKRAWDPQLARYRMMSVPNPDYKPPPKVEEVKPVDDIEAARRELTQGYQALRMKAMHLLADMMHLQSLQKKVGIPSQSSKLSRIQGIVDGKKEKTSADAATVVPPNVKVVSRSVQKTPENATGIILTDFEEYMAWMKASQAKNDNDSIRDALVKRKNALEHILPEDLKIHSDLALTHIEHESLGRNYANTETMLGDEVKDIPRENFYVTEDNYAWDMDELVQALKANSGVFRNPLSKEMFTPKDIKGILMHPVGKPLGAVAVEQRELSKGVRPATIQQMEKLAAVLLEDQSSDALPSRQACDDFLAHVATLPNKEQKSIHEFKCPAKDSHTGMAYDFTIGESVRDAKGNRVCFHKTGDFIKQAAAYLKTKR